MIYELVLLSVGAGIGLGIAGVCLYFNRERRRNEEQAYEREASGTADVQRPDPRRVRMPRAASQPMGWE